MTIDLSAEQFEQLLRRIVQEETAALASQRSVQDLTTMVDGLSKKLSTYLDHEWNVHLHTTHPDIETRLKAIERKVGINAA